MKLLSKFKDYYDYLAHQYKDEKVVYDRTTIKNTKIPYKDIKNIRDFPRWRDDPKGGLSTFRYLVINGCYYLLVGNNQDPTDTYELLNMDKHKHLEGHLFKRGWFWRQNVHDITYYIGYKDDALIELSKKVGHPVFIIKSIDNDYIEIDSKIPKLTNYEIPAILSATQIYQELVYFLSNVLKDSPDMQPPIKINDKLKIASHGFDLKESFRNRKL